MNDRTPTKPGRVLITPESGVPYYAVLTMADEPTQEGTPPTKANLFSDITKAMYTGADVPNDALKALGKALLLADTAIKDPLGNLIAIPYSQLDNPVQIVAGHYTGTGTYGSSNPTIINMGIPAKVLIIMAHTGIGSYENLATPIVILLDRCPTAYSYYLFNSSSEHIKKSADGKTVYIYSTSSATEQFNNQYNAQWQYDFLAIGWKI